MNRLAFLTSLKSLKVVKEHLKRTGILAFAKRLAMLDIPFLLPTPHKIGGIRSIS